MESKDIKMLLKELGAIRAALEHIVQFITRPITHEERSALTGVEGIDDEDDPLYTEAKKAVLQAGKATASYIQRKLGVGYARAAKLIEMLEQRGVIGPAVGSLPRRVIHRLTPDVVATLEKIEKQLKKKKK